MEPIDTKVGWIQYHNAGVITDDTMLLAMLGEMVQTIRSLERIYPSRQAEVVIGGMLIQYHSLASMAFHRGFHDHPRL